MQELESLLGVQGLALHIAGLGRSQVGAWKLPKEPGITFVTSEKHGDLFSFAEKVCVCVRSPGLETGQKGIYERHLRERLGEILKKLCSGKT